MPIENKNNALRDFSALVDFSNLINSSLDINFTLNNLLLTCFGKFHTTKGIIALVGSDEKLNLVLQKGISNEVIKAFPNISTSMIADNCSELDTFLKEFNFELCEKIESHEGIKGIVILGPRLTKQNYNNEDISFLRTLLNIGAIAIENSSIVNQLKIANRTLDSKLNQLSSLFDLSKEFNGVLKIGMIGKLLAFSIIGQLLVSKFAVVIASKNKVTFLENKFSESKLKNVLTPEYIENINETIIVKSNKEYSEKFNEFEIELIIPMQIKGKTKGVILLGSRKNNLPYSQSDIEFSSSVGSLAIMSIENAKLVSEIIEKERIEKDLETAKSIQQNLLPSNIPENDAFEIAAINRTARHVGGDYYDVVKLDEERTLFAIADVSGKGVQAALLMANLQAFLKSICKQNIELAEASNLINDLVSENTSGGSFITFFWGIYNKRTRDFQYVNAGHNPPLLIREGEIDYLKKGGMILGVMKTMVPYMSRTYTVESGDVVVLFTDGITEAMDKHSKEYSDQRLEELVSKNSHLNPDQMLDTILDDVAAYTKGAQQSDDITCMIIKFK